MSSTGEFNLTLLFGLCALCLWFCLCGLSPPQLYSKFLPLSDFTGLHSFKFPLKFRFTNQHGREESQGISDTSVNVNYKSKVETCPGTSWRGKDRLREVWAVGIYPELWGSVFQTGADTSLRTPKLTSAPRHPTSILCNTISGVNIQEMRHASWAAMEKKNRTKHSQPTAPILCTLEWLHLSKN